MLDELRSSARRDLSEPLKLSRLDVLLAHLWSAIKSGKEAGAIIRRRIY